MSLPYNSFAYIKPPRAEAKRSPIAIGQYERRGWQGQVKKNGTNSVVFVPPTRKVFGWNRHAEAHRAWQFSGAPAEASEVFQSLPGEKWFVFNGELLHSKGPGYKNIHFLYDMLVCEGVHLTGTTYEYRYQLMLDLLLSGNRLTDSALAEHDHYTVNPLTWIARNYTNTRHLFDTLPEAPKVNEGVVMRDPKGVYYGAKADSWMVKIRK
jgi:hypothetical protein